MAGRRHSSSPSDDLGSTDEVKVFKEEGGREDENISSENLLEEKSSLIDLTESEEKCVEISTGSGLNKFEHSASVFNMGYLVAPFSYPKGTTGGLPATIANRITLYDNPPPPAHCGIPPYQLDAKSLYSLHSSQYPHAMLGPDLSQVAPWHPPPAYATAPTFPLPFHHHTPTATTTGLPSDLSFRFSPNILNSIHRPPHSMIDPQHYASATPCPKTDYNQEISVTHRKATKNVQRKDEDPKKPHIKKPLNAFMLYMKEMRAKVVAECTLKESAAINQILGRRWHELSREEQSVYYEKARRERQLHMEMYPGYVLKNSKRKRERSTIKSAKTAKSSESVSEYLCKN